MALYSTFLKQEKFYSWMWVARIKLKGENSLFGCRSKKHNVSLKAYPLSQSNKRDKISVYVAGEVFGNPENVDAFINDLSEAKEVLSMERSEKFIILNIERSQDFKIFYNLNFVHFKPIFIDQNGDNYFEIGCFNRDELTEFVASTEKEYCAELLYIMESSVNRFSIISPYPDITSKQRDAFELAVREGYYEFPKKIEIEKLAKIKNISFSTYRAHLKKAESKLMEFIFGHL